MVCVVCMSHWSADTTRASSSRGGKGRSNQRAPPHQGRCLVVGLLAMVAVLVVVVIVVVVEVVVVVW